MKPQDNSFSTFSFMTISLSSYNKNIPFGMCERLLSSLVKVYCRYVGFILTYKIPPGVLLHKSLVYID